MIESVQSIIKNKSYPQILLMFGEEDFLLEEDYNQLISFLLSNGGNEYDFEIFDAEESGSEEQLRRIVDSCIAFPFIAERRIVVVRHFDKLFSSRSKKFNEKSAFARYLANPQKSTFLILLASVDSLSGLAAAMSDSRNASKAQKIISGAKYPYSILLDKYSWTEYAKIYESGYASWIKKKFNEAGRTISDDACQYLVANTASSLRELYNQADKVITYMNDKKEANLDLVSSVIGFSKVYNVFELQKVIGKRNLNDAMYILQKMLQEESQEILILTMLTRYFITLWKLSEAAKNEADKYKIADSAGINRYFINEYMDALKKYSPKEIEDSFEYLVETDELLKSTSIDKPALMQQMLINIMEPKK